VWVVKLPPKHQPLPRHSSATTEYNKIIAPWNDKFKRTTCLRETVTEGAIDSS